MPDAKPARPQTREGTQERILSAAQSEFARHGIAGARVDRIAKAARTSKERVYAYFHSKEELYSVVARHQLTLAAEAAPLDPRDLPTYAGALFDYFTTHSDRLRFLSWGRLELTPEADTADLTFDPTGDGAEDAAGGPGTAAAGPSDPYGKSMIAKVEKLRQAQQAGHLDPSWDPVDVLALVSQIAFTNAGQPELADLARRVAADTSTGARRAAVVRAVSALFPPAKQDEAS
ncbi:TetR family transcriptional regulator [Micromonospora sp. NPDC005206]|uniref:TetR family transcriptional regulator n=1 Tax=Micromonospora sp. NPDC005206 TaxID=3157022 RepID=UPI0033A560C3